MVGQNQMSVKMSNLATVRPKRDETRAMKQCLVKLQPAAETDGCDTRRISEMLMFGLWWTAGRWF